MQYIGDIDDADIGPVPYQKIPQIGSGTYYMRTRQTNLIESILHHDFNALTEIVSYYNSQYHSRFAKFHADLNTLLLQTFPKSTIVEAGSSGMKSK